jgi:pimeloyl-ACP methyl ester carboxylesterase
MLLAHELVGHYDAPVIVLVHGITESHRSWRPIIEPLAASHQVLAVDLRGHGDSERTGPYDPASYAGDVVDTIDALGLDAPLLVGHSLGGVVVTACASVVDCVGIVNVDQPLQLSGFREALAALEPMLRGSDDQFRAALDTLFASLTGPLPEAEAQRVAGLRHPEQSVVLGTWAAVLERPAEELDELVQTLAGRVHVPYLSLFGGDPGPGYASWLQALIPSAVVEVWADHGHYPQLVDPHRFVSRVCEFDAQVRG